MDDFSRSLAAAALIDGQHFSLPGCGTIEGIYVSAKIDHASKTVEPPYLEVRWTNVIDNNAQTFAELLENTGATSAEANATQNHWLTSLESGLPIQLGDLGELKFDEETERIGFFANEPGLKQAYWSNGDVNIEPLVHRKTEKEDATVVAAVAPSTTNERVSGSEKVNRNFFRKAAPYLAAAVIAVCGLLLFNGLNNGSPLDQDEKGQAVAVNHDRLNRSPREDVATTADMTEATENESVQREIITSSGQENPNTENFDPENLGSTQENLNAIPGGFDPAGLAGMESDELGFEHEPIELVIVVGSFGNRENATKMMEKIASKGFNPYLDQVGNLTRVGVTFMASNEQEVADMVQQMRAQFNPSAWLLE